MKNQNKIEHTENLSSNDLYKGYTADNAGVIIDTSKGRIDLVDNNQNNKEND